LIDGGAQGGITRAMGANYQTRIIAMTFLVHHLDAHTVVSESRGNAGEYTRLVCHVQVDVVLSLRLPNRKHG
jgi:hypothetical protein